MKTYRFKLTPVTKSMKNPALVSGFEKKAWEGCIKTCRENDHESTGSFKEEIHQTKFLVSTYDLAHQN